MLKVIELEFPFIDSPRKTKIRPGILLTKPRGKYNLVIVAFVTTKTKDILDTDLLIDSSKNYFHQTGLKYKSMVRLHKLTAVQLKSVKGEIGELPHELDKEMKEKLKKLFNL